jgi:xanthine dehydrogenase accessory factor
MNASVYRSLKSELEKGRKAAVVTFISMKEGGREASKNKIIVTEEQLFNHAEKIPGMDAPVTERAKSALKTGILQYFQTSSGTSILIEPYFPRPHLIVLGGENIAKPLVEFGARAGFLATVVDDRPMLANRDRFPNAERVICCSFENCLSQFDLNEYSFVVIIVREHRHDLDCLKQALNCKTAYIGMIGSRRSVNSMKEQLLKAGCPAGQIERLNAPIGLDIGAITPEEIAISIMAQVISCRRHIRITTEDAADTVWGQANWPELDGPVLEELCKDAGESKALVTIIETQGPAPGKAGAKMLVWPYGMTVGNVGGGYAEGELINAAWQVIGTGRSALHEIDMTGRIAQEEGMVCGGIMRVLIEDYPG